MRWALPIIAAAIAYAGWRWAPLLLDPIGLSEFLFVGRACLIAALLTATETIHRKAVP